MRKNLDMLFLTSIFLFLVCLVNPSILNSKPAVEFRGGSSCLDLGVKLTPDLRDTALVIIDMNHVDTSEDVGMVPILKEQGMDLSSYTNRVNQLVIPNTKKLLNIFRKKQAMIIYTILGSDHSDFRDMPKLNRNLFDTIGVTKSYPGKKEFQVREELKPEPGEIILTKPGSNAFTHTRLDKILQWNGIKQIVIVGVVTPFCVGSTAYSAFDLGYGSIVVNDATAHFSQAQHDNYLTIMGGSTSCIMDTDEIISKIEGHLKQD